MYIWTDRWKGKKKRQETGYRREEDGKGGEVYITIASLVQFLTRGGVRGI